MFIIKTILATFGSIIVMFLIPKLLGNKQISELNVFDYIMGITLGFIASEMAVADTSKDMWVAAVAMVIYGLVTFILSVITIKSIKARRLFSGTPLLLIEDGKMYPENIKTAKIDNSDLLTRARNSGYGTVDQNNTLTLYPQNDKKVLKDYFQ